MKATAHERDTVLAYLEAQLDDDLVPDGTEPPKGADVVGWTNLLAQQLAAGSSSEQRRSYIKRLARETWDYVNKLTHAKNAGG